MLANKRVRMGIVGLLIVVVGYMFVLPKMQGSTPVGPIQLPEHPNPGPTYTLESRVYNLLTPASQQARYLKMGLVFEFAEEDPAFFLLEGEALALTLEQFAEELKPKRPVIEDAISGIVSAKSWTDLSTPLGRKQLKEALLQAIGEVVGEPPVLNVYFTEFVSQ